ncbi:uncharacterized protein LOC120344673 [Styela clava]
MKLFIFICTVLQLAYGQKQQYAPMQFAVKGKEVKLPCAVPTDATFLKWRFQRNGTDFIIDAAQVFPGYIPKVFGSFDTPAGRSELVSGNFIIHDVIVMDEGEYWCEIATATAPTAYSRKYPLHVYVTPLDPQVTAIGNNTLTEYQNTTVARCSSQAGKPGARLTWMNGSQPMSKDMDIVYKENAFDSTLSDAALDLVITNPTRFDHNRSFQCVVDHPSYHISGTGNKILSYTIFVMYHPINIRIWANLTSLHVFCEAEGYPAPSYSWKMPGGLYGFTGPSLLIQDLWELPGYDYFECTANNGIPPNATTRVKVDDLLYPDGKPGWLGLDWWVWGAIFGGIAAFVLIIVVIVCCLRHRKKASGKAHTAKYTKPLKKPIVESQDYAHTPPSSLQVDLNYRRPDGREDSFDSRTPSPVNEHKQALIDGVFNKSMENVTLIPSGNLRHSRENLYSDNRKSMHASREQLDQVASHIQTLNKSWDQLSKSRQQLNDAQDELQDVSSNLRKSREQLYHSQERLNDTDQNYPYIDDNTTRSNDYNRRYDDQDGGYGRQEPQGYDYSDQGTYDQRQGYDENRQGYDDRQGHDTYRDDQDRYQDRYSRHDNYDSYDQNPPRYDDSSYDRYDDRQDYNRYEDDRYRKDDRYPPSRIV